MSEITMRSGHVTQVDDADLALLAGKAPYMGANGYAYLTFWVEGRSRPTTLHGWLVGAPSGMHVDHISGDKLDNRRANLRVVTTQVNQVNRKRLNRNNSSGHRGVIHRPGTLNPWIAQITVNRRGVYLGSFSTVSQALAARQAAELAHFGELCPR